MKTPSDHEDGEEEGEEEGIARPHDQEGITGERGGLEEKGR